ncbi:tetratricopeptide repeat protein [Alteromonas aestuariivivens]|uniref:Tetratricopeptide repeat protein n=1 Tax=Alteromonas aestuariivivens TaxID=1938339 RepID=A0A3D8MCD4_9ALTE|nr:tetratricopeptide repeat protein [Alteromonas aestuariivivens]RDV28184.1 tetratricopeptide repeat protein [Alteromonas aestuariivivens]
MKISKPLLLATIIGLLAGCASTSEEQAGLEHAVNKVQPTPEQPSLNRFAQNRKSLPSSADGKLSAALQAFSGQEYAEALSTVTGLIAVCSDCSNLYVLQGDIYQAMEQTQDSAAAWLKAVAVNPDNYQAHTRLGQWYRQQGDFEQALNHYQAAQSAWPEFAPLYLNRGILYDLYLGDKAAALADYTRYQQLKSAGAEEFLQSDSGKQLARWQAQLNRQLTEAATDDQSQVAPGGK